MRANRGATSPISYTRAACVARAGSMGRRPLGRSYAQSAAASIDAALTAVQGQLPTPWASLPGAEALCTAHPPTHPRPLRGIKLSIFRNRTVRRIPPAAVLSYRLRSRMFPRHALREAPCWDKKVFNVALRCAPLHRAAPGHAMAGHTKRDDGPLLPCALHVLPFPPFAHPVTTGLALTPPPRPAPWATPRQR